ncbi:MAG: hypothetical protein FJ149_07525 [Euryarchaeota archaeon]|nr:hypothetical protein [Euryarchaeota archaeon]
MGKGGKAEWQKGGQQGSKAGRHQGVRNDPSSPCCLAALLPCCLPLLPSCLAAFPCCLPALLPCCLAALLPSPAARCPFSLRALPAPLLEEPLERALPPAEGPAAERRQVTHAAQKAPYRQEGARYQHPLHQCERGGDDQHDDHPDRVHREQQHHGPGRPPPGPAARRHPPSPCALRPAPRTLRPAPRTLSFLPERQHLAAVAAQLVLLRLADAHDHLESGPPQ